MILENGERVFHITEAITRLGLAPDAAHQFNKETCEKFTLFWVPLLRDEETTGFKFIALEWHSTFTDGPYRSDYFSIVVEGVGYFDGVRHLHLIPEDYSQGYACYPDIPSYIKLFTRLRELELEFCWDAKK